MEELSKSIWNSGPKWLKENAAVWPTSPDVSITPEEMSIIKSEIRGPEKLFEVSLITTMAAIELTKDIYPFSLLAEAYSDLYRMYRITAYCYRFINRLSKKYGENGPIRTDEYKFVKLKWELAVQSICFYDVLTWMKNNRKCNLQDNFLYGLIQRDC